jgi:hypothetical protein
VSNTSSLTRHDHRVDNIHDTDAEHENEVDLLFQAELQLDKAGDGQPDDPQVGSDVQGAMNPPKGC